MSQNRAIISLVILIGILSLFSCWDVNPKFKEATQLNYDFVISNIQNSTTELWSYNVRRSFNIHIRRPKLVEQIDASIKTTHSVSKELYTMILEDKFDCSIFESKLDESYSLLISEFNSTLDSIYVKAKLKLEEVEERKLKFKMKITSENSELAFCKRPVSNEYLTSEIVRLNSATNTLISELSLFLSLPKERHFNLFPVIIPSKSIYKSGEVFTADIGVGNFAKMSVSKAFIEVNGETFEYFGEGIKYKEQVPPRKGKRILDIKYIEENLDNGMLEQKSSISFEYDIK